MATLIECFMSFDLVLYKFEARDAEGGIILHRSKVKIF